MKDLMIDFETLGNGKNACIIQVAAVYFDRISGQLGDEIKLNFDARDVVKHGGELDADTVYWWLSQSREAIDSISKGTMTEFVSGMHLLNSFLGVEAKIWSHATFDFVILTETLKRLNIKPIFSYRAARDIRTLLDLGKIDYKKYPREGVHHDALDDCKHQIKYCLPAFKKLENIE